MELLSLPQHIVRQAQEASWPANLVTIGAVVIWVSVASSAWRRGQHHTLALLVGTLFCLVSENVAIQMGKYHYSQFALSLPALPIDLRPSLAAAADKGWILPLPDCNGRTFPLGVPVEIALLEGTLLYAVFRLTNLLSPQISHTHFSWRHPLQSLGKLIPSLGSRLPNPMLNGFLAVSLDSVLDPVVSTGVPCATGQAEGLLWTWHITSYYQGHWFTVPLANYTAWFAALFAFTAAVRVGPRALMVAGGRVRKGWHLIYSMLRAVALLTLLLFLIKVPLDHLMYKGFSGGPDPMPPEWQFLVSATFPLAGIYGALRIAARRERTASTFERVTIASLVFVFTYSFVTLVVDAAQSRSLWLIPIWFLTAAIAAIHASSPFREKLRQPSPPQARPTAGVGA